MTWSKVVLFIINLSITSIYWICIPYITTDMKITAGIYVCYTFTFVFFSDWLSSIDKGTAISKARVELIDHKEKITNYKNCVLHVHHEIVMCVGSGIKGAQLKSILSTIIIILGDITTKESFNKFDYSMNSSSDAKKGQSFNDVESFIK